MLSGCVNAISFPLCSWAVCRIMEYIYIAKKVMHIPSYCIVNSCSEQRWCCVALALSLSLSLACQTGADWPLLAILSGPRPCGPFSIGCSLGPFGRSELPNGEGTSPPHVDIRVECGSRTSTLVCVLMLQATEG